MPEATAPSNQPTDTALDGITWFELGRIEHKHRLEQPLTETEQAIRAAALETSCGEGSTRGIILAHAARLYKQHLEQQIREHGGTIIKETHRVRNGRRILERRVDHFPPPKSLQAADPARRSRPRARGAGRPKAQATRSSARSGDSGDEGPSDEPPPRRRLCGFCGKEIPADRGPKAKHCSDKHAANARQRRKRQRLVDEDAVGALLDWIMDGEGLTSEQERALHEPLAAV